MSSLEVMLILVAVIVFGIGGTAWIVRLINRGDKGADTGSDDASQQSR
ncbi:hypothetical protein HNR42_003441 [Deinobacterium chartae]|uniref:Uncharacterized protein n=1 Tax=Deinobacterium chartae TaxID=521158 RepID=A0A841I6D2_9DEIO|nr:hypothetical protein [Deinobacterium chartae]MBB6099980.1 hypothetical protein [Deinobacterium chartae]